jgi:hypothetical protein
VKGPLRQPPSQQLTYGAHSEVGCLGSREVGCPGSECIPMSFQAGGLSSPSGSYRADRSGFFPQENLDYGELFYLRSWQGIGTVRAFVFFSLACAFGLSFS